MSDHDAVRAVVGRGAHRRSDLQPFHRGQLGAVEGEEIHHLDIETVDEFRTTERLPQHPFWVRTGGNGAAGGDDDKTRHPVIIAAAADTATAGLRSRTRAPRNGTRG